MELSERIKKIVEYSGLSIPKFAEFVGFKTPQTVTDMVLGNPQIPLSTRFYYHFVTISLYFPSFLGLNMIEPSKLLVDSRLAALLFVGSNKTAPKVYENAPIFGRGKVKIKLLK